MSNGDESYDYRQGYAQGYRNGFWSGGIASFLGTVLLLYLVGIYIN